MAVLQPGHELVHFIGRFHRGGVPKPLEGPGRARASQPKDLFDFANLFLNLTRDLIGAALRFEPGIADGMAGARLDLAREILDGAFEFIAGARFRMEG
jgi:hypothetical protein